MIKFFKILIPICLILFYVACDSDISEEDLFTFENPELFTLKVSTQVSASNCGGDSVDVVGFDITYLNNEEQFGLNGYRDSVQIVDSLVTTIMDSAQFQSSTTLGLIVRLVDFDTNNPNRDFGEQLKNLRVQINTDSAQIFNQTLQDLQICDSIKQYAVQINHNVVTDSTTVTYLQGG